MVDDSPCLVTVTEKLNFLPSEKPGREECVKALKNAYVVPKDENASEIQVFQKGKGSWKFVLGGQRAENIVNCVVLEWIEESGDSDRGSNTTPVPPYS